MRSCDGERASERAGSKVTMHQGSTVVASKDQQLSFMISNSQKRKPVFGVIGAVCVLLVCLTGFVTAVHVHPARSSTPERTCSTCALAHLGVVAVGSGPSVPMLVAAELLESSAELSPSFPVRSSQ